MPRTPRLFVSGKIYEICFRTEEGLPLVCTPYMKIILEGILVRAFSMFDCQLLSNVAMANHMHLHLRVGNPEHVDDIVAYIKRESAHAVNNLLGRIQHTVWQAGYDAVLVLDVEKMIERLSYVYLNPARAGLETSIANYPGVNSWKSVLEDGFVLKARKIPRESIPALPSNALSLEEQAAFAASLLDEAGPEETISVDPLSFLEAFPGAHLDREIIRASICKRVTEQEAELNSKRTFAVIGAHALRLQSMRVVYQPKKFGRKMWVFGSTKEIRRHAIDWLKEQFTLLRELREKIPRHEFSQQLFPGFFAPGGILRANINPALVPF